IVVIWWLLGHQTRKTILRGVVATVVATAVLAPWAIRNSLVFGRFVAITTGEGMALWGGANATATGGKEKTDDSEWTVIKNLDEAALHREGTRRGMQYIREHPFAWIGLMPRKLFIMYECDEEGLWFATISGD